MCPDRTPIDTFRLVFRVCRPIYKPDGIVVWSIPQSPQAFIDHRFRTMPHGLIELAICILS